MLNFGDRHLTDKVACVLDCCENIDLLSVFDLDSQSSPKEMDLVILKALLKGERERERKEGREKERGEEGGREREREISDT